MKPFELFQIIDKIMDAGDFLSRCLLSAGLAVSLLSAIGVCAVSPTVIKRGFHIM